MSVPVIIGTLVVLLAGLWCFGKALPDGLDFRDRVRERQAADRAANGDD